MCVIIIIVFIFLPRLKCGDIRDEVSERKRKISNLELFLLYLYREQYDIYYGKLKLLLLFFVRAGDEHFGFFYNYYQRS